MSAVVCPIEALPEEILLEIFSLLPLPTRLVVRHVNERWRRVGSDKHLWRHVSLPLSWAVGLSDYARQNNSNLRVSLEISGWENLGRMSQLTALLSQMGGTLECVTLKSIDDQGLLLPIIRALPVEVNRLRLIRESVEAPELNAELSRLVNLTHLELCIYTEFHLDEEADVNFFFRMCHGIPRLRSLKLTAHLRSFGSRPAHFHVDEISTETSHSALDSITLADGMHVANGFFSPDRFPSLKELIVSSHVSEADLFGTETPSRTLEALYLRMFPQSLHPSLRSLTIDARSNTFEFPMDVVQSLPVRCPVLQTLRVMCSERVQTSLDWVAPVFAGLPSLQRVSIELLAHEETIFRDAPIADDIRIHETLLEDCVRLSIRYRMRTRTGRVLVDYAFERRK